VTATVTAPTRRSGLTMAALVERSGVGASAVRFYLAEGLLPPPERLAANRFAYDERHVELLQLIRLLRERRRLSLPAIRQLLPELLPDLTGSPDGGVFRPELWRQLLAPPGESAHGTAERIVEEALGAFSGRGYFDVSIDDVCRAAQIAKGSFYRHFRSKEELLTAVVRRATARVAASVREPEAAIVEPAPFAERLSAALIPFRSLLFDLASLASTGHAAESAALGEMLADLAGLVLDADPLADATTTVDAALAALVRASAAGAGAPARAAVEAR